MNFELRTSLNYKRTVAFLSFMTVISGAVSAFMFQLGVLFVPFTAAFYASLLTFERRTKRIMSYVVPVLLVVIEILLSGFYSLNCLWSVFIGAVVFLFCKRGYGKAQGAIAVSALVFVLVAISTVLLGFLVTESLSLDRVAEYYDTVYNGFRDEFVQYLLTLTTKSEGGVVTQLFSEQTATEMFDQAISMIVPMTFVFSFLMAGITYKSYTAIVFRHAKDAEPLFNWRFKANSVFAYFFFAVCIINFFITDLNSVASLSIMTLYIIFMVVFAYIGCCIANAMLTHKFGRGRSVLILTLGICLFSGFAIQLLSLFGAFMTVMAGKFDKRESPSDESDNNNFRH